MRARWFVLTVALGLVALVAAVDLTSPPVSDWTPVTVWRILEPVPGRGWLLVTRDYDYYEVPESIGLAACAGRHELLVRWRADGLVYRWVTAARFAPVAGSPPPRCR